MPRCLDKRVHTIMPILLKKRNQASKNIKAMKNSSVKKIILARFDNRINKNMINILNHHPKLIFLKDHKKTKSNKNQLFVNNNKKSLNINLEP